MKIICQSVKLPKTSVIFARNISHRLISEFSHCFCPNFQLLLPEFREKAMGNSGKSNGNSGKSNGKIWAKAMRKVGKRRHIFRAKFVPFARISHCFFLKFPLLLPEFSITFSQISHCFCPNFPSLLPNFPLLLPEFFVFRNLGGGGTVPPPAPPSPPTPMFPHTFVRKTRAEICLLCMLFYNTNHVSDVCRSIGRASCIAPHSSARIRITLGILARRH